MMCMQNGKHTDAHTQTLPAGHATLAINFTRKCVTPPGGGEGNEGQRAVLPLRFFEGTLTNLFYGNCKIGTVNSQPRVGKKI